MADLIREGDQVLYFCLIRAATPAMCGELIEVPEDRPM
jgi:hypothetical protein